MTPMKSIDYFSWAITVADEKTKKCDLFANSESWSEENFFKKGI